MRVLSLGWGVQTWTLAAMAAVGAIKKPDIAVHADTGFEKQGTYEFAKKWTPWLEERGVNVHTTPNNGPKSQPGRILPKGTGEVMIPVFSGSGGVLSRQCTGEWKIMPIRRAIRKMLPKGDQAISQIGISADEWKRAKDSDVKYIANEHPLIDMRMTRQDCLDWLADEKLPAPPKSSCVFCPYQRRAAFRDMLEADGSDAKVAVWADELVREKRPPWPVFVHPDRVPLKDVLTLQPRLLAEQDTFDPEGKCDEGVCWV